MAQGNGRERRGRQSPMLGWSSVLLENLSAAAAFMQTLT
jgi:hypothetical protein